MQQFTVPQFIDVEDKIIGPITTRQFLITLAASMLIAVCYKILDFSAFLLASILIFAAFGTVAFTRVNGRPFHFFILNVIQTMKRPNLRVWNHILSKDGTEEIDEMPIAPPSLPKFAVKEYSVSRLAELSLIVDTKGSYRGENTNWKADIQTTGRKEVE